MHNNNNNNNNFKIEERRRNVASMLAQSMTETEIAKQPNVDQSTIMQY
jgi:DNA-binding NarL/FixJ family response regulator